MNHSQNNIASTVAKILKGVLIIDANTNSSTMLFQPKFPGNKNEFKINKK